jgi:hypothetical protein
VSGRWRWSRQSTPRADAIAAAVAEALAEMPAVEHRVLPSVRPLALDGDTWTLFCEVCGGLSERYLVDEPEHALTAFATRLRHLRWHRVQDEEAAS